MPPHAPEALTLRGRIIVILYPPGHAQRNFNSLLRR
jgi:hypothetical protein